MHGAMTALGPVFGHVGGSEMHTIGFVVATARPVPPPPTTTAATTLSQVGSSHATTTSSMKN